MTKADSLRARLDPVSILLPLAVFLLDIAAGNITSTDSFWTVPVASSLLHSGDIDLDEFEPMLDLHGYRDTFSHAGHRFYLFPAGTPIVTVPFVAAAEAALGLATEAWPGLPRFVQAHTANRFERLDAVAIAPRIELVMAAFLLAMASLVFYATLRRITGNRLEAVFLTSVLIFCTPAFSTAGRALWSHTTSLLLVTLVLYLLVLAREGPLRGALLGALLGFGFFLRPTNAITAVLTAVYVLAVHRRSLTALLLGACASVACMAAFDWFMYDGLLLPDYFSPSRLSMLEGFPEAAAGNLFSPARGLLVYCPFLVFAAPGVAGAFRPGPLRGIFALCSGIVLLHWLAISFYPHWWGGWSFGPRFFTEVTPFLVLLLAPFTGGCRKARGRGRRALEALFALLVLVALVIHSRGACRPATMEWNSFPANVDTYPSRVWDWGDLQFLRGLEGV